MEPQGPIPKGRVTRVAPLAGMAGRTAGEAVVASLRKRRGDPRGEDFHQRNAERYAAHLGHSRGVLMKAGQILSMVIPETAVESDYRGVYQRAFAKLFDSAPPMPTEVAIATVEAELGRPLPEVFASFDPKPVAAASIGQVHAAALHDGTRVAVKVQYPGVEAAIRADLANTELVGTFLQLLLSAVPSLSRMDARGMAKEMSERIGEEIDYLAEAANQREFADAYRGHPFIRIPDVHDDLTTRRVLAMKFVDGMRYDEAKLAGRELRDRWGEAIYRFIYGSLWRFGLNNTDPHPGNYLFHPDGSVTFLDFGCVKRLTRPYVEGVFEVQRLTMARDADGVHRCLLRVGYLHPDPPVDPDDVLGLVTDTYDYLTAPQPFAFAPEFMADKYRQALSGPYKRLTRQATAPIEGTMMLRMGTGIFSVLGGLRASGNWRAIHEHCCGDAPPSTAYGELDSEFWMSKE